MTNTIRTDTTTPHGVSHNVFSALLDEFDTLKEKVATLEREILHKDVCYIPPEKPFPSLADRTYEAVCWCLANEIQIEFLRNNIRASEWRKPFDQAIVKETFLEAVAAMKQKMEAFATIPTLSFEDAKVGQRVQFYDHEKKVWRDAMVLIITHAYFDIDTVTLRPNDGTDFPMSRQAWDEIGVRVRPTPPKETP